MLYEITLEVDGLIVVELEAETEEEAVRRARLLGEMGEGARQLDLTCVRVTPKAAT
jgi:hypothetical protein